MISRPEVWFSSRTRNYGCAGGNILKPRIADLHLSALVIFALLLGVRPSRSDDCLRYTDLSQRLECVKRFEEGSASQNDLAPVRDPEGEKMLFAAAVILSDLSHNFGEIVIESPDRAHFANGSAFFYKNSDCNYSQYYPSQKPFHWFETVDFRAITGNYITSKRLGISSIDLEGISPKTRCFSFDGQRGWCTASLSMTIGTDEQRRVINNLQFLMDHCPKPKAQPY